MKNKRKGRKELIQYFIYMFNNEFSKARKMTNNSTETTSQFHDKLSEAQYCWCIIQIHIIAQDVICGVNRGTTRQHLYGIGCNSRTPFL